nr:aminopeptidase P family N-terminal domain-containing protein [Candidatus Njordarchaeum guaymaensis]
MEPIAYDIKKVSRLMRSKGVNVLIASTPENVFYTSGMPVRHIENNPILYVLGNQYPSLVVIKQDGDEALISWQLFSSTPIASWIKDVRGCMSVDDALNSLVALVQESKLSSGETIGIESRMPYYQYEHLAKQFPKTKIRVSDDVFIEMRLEKSEEEIRRIRESTRITEKAIEAMINMVTEGVS